MFCLGITGNLKVHQYIYYSFSVKISMAFEVEITLDSYMAWLKLTKDIFGLKDQK
jgi:hypothetical protein